jgi:hypothetical protein
MMAIALSFAPPDLRFMGRFNEESVRPGAVLVASVAPHLHADAIVLSLREVGSMLREGARVMATFFLMDPSQREAAAVGRSRYPLRYGVGDIARCGDADDPFHAIAYDQAWVHRQARCGGPGVHAVHLGSRHGRAGSAVSQYAAILAPGELE